MTYKQKKQISILVDSISTELKIEKSVVIHFLITDLERIFKEKIQDDNLKLIILENEISKLTKTEKELTQELERKGSLIRNVYSNIDNITELIKTKSEILTTKNQELSILQNKLSQINTSIRENEKQKKQVEYDVMMKSHSVKEKNEKSTKYLKIFLTIITIIAIIIVTLLIYKK